MTPQDKKELRFILQSTAEFLIAFTIVILIATLIYKIWMIY
jgi:hypothetical protein